MEIEIKAVWRGGNKHFYVLLAIVLNATLSRLLVKFVINRR